MSAARCVAEIGQTTDIFFTYADIWCSESSCFEYDPGEYFEVETNSGRHLCSGAGIYSGFNCITYYGGSPPSFFGIPDLYCNGSESSPVCSDLWYPSALQDENVRTIGGVTYICRSALDYAASRGDTECGPYGGGNPSNVNYGYGSLLCTPSRGGSLECSTDYFPSEWDAISTSRIDGRDYYCLDENRGQECYYAPYITSPRDIPTYLRPDYYCNYRGCSEDGYP